MPIGGTTVTILVVVGDDVDDAVVVDVVNDDVDVVGVSVIKVRQHNNIAITSQQHHNNMIPLYYDTVNTTTKLTAHARWRNDCPYAYTSSVFLFLLTSPFIRSTFFFFYPFFLIVAYCDQIFEQRATSWRVPLSLGCVCFAEFVDWCNVLAASY